MRTFRVLGSLEIAENGRLSPIMKSAKGCALLAYLIVTGQSQTREHVADLFWDTSTVNALRNLRKVIYEARQAVPELQVTRKTVTFHGNVDTFVDIHLLQRALQQTDVRQLDSGLQRYRGELLATFYLDSAPRFNEWLTLARERLRAEVNHAYQRVCHAYAGQQLWLEGISAAQRWLALDDLNETAHRWLIQFLANNGQWAAAQQQYELCRMRLWDELQIEPEEATRRLMAQLKDRSDRSDTPAAITPVLHEVPPTAATLPEPGLPPAGSVLPHQRHPDFTGREADLRHLADCLLPAQSDEVPVVAITGVAGVGKTQLAVEFAYRYGRYFPGGVYWLSFAQADSVAEEVAATGGEHGLQLFTPAEKLTLAAQVRRVQQAWQQNVPRLLIFDNCEAVELLKKWRPPVGGCRILLTSQKGVWEADGRLITHPLDTLARAESVTLLTRFVEKMTIAEAERIASELGDLPLALHLAGSFLQRYWTIDPQRYLQQLAQIGPFQHPSLKGRGVLELPTGHDWDIARTFALNFVQLDPAADVDRSALLLLACMVTFAHGEPVPQQILLTAVSAAPDDLDAELLAMDGLIRLANLGIVTLNGRQTAQIHRLIAAYALVELGDQLTEGQALAEKYILQLLQTQYQQTRFMGPLPIAATHLQKMTERGLQRGNGRGPALAVWWGRHLRDVGDLQAARDVLATAVALQRTLFPAGDLLLADLLSILGTLMWEMGASDDAWPYYAEVLHIRRRVLGEIHSLTAQSLQNLAILHSRTGAFEKAKATYEQALSIYEQLDPPDEKFIALAANNLGMLLRRMGRLSEAEAQYRRALAIREKIYPPNHPDTAMSLNSLGYLAGLRGDYETALRFHERAVQIRQAVFGRVHTMTALSLMNLGVIQSKMGAHAAAEAYLQEALSIRQQQLPADHPHVGQSLFYLGEHKVQVGDIAAAMTLLTDSLTISQVKRPEDAETADALVALARCYLQQDQPDKARDCLQQAEAIQEKQLVPLHLRTAYRWLISGDLARAQGDTNLARHCYEQARDIWQATAVSTHPDLRTVQQKLAELVF